MSVPYTFASATTSLPLSQLDSNFAYFADAITVSSGNVGIGIASPTTKLEVSGSVAANSFVPTSSTPPTNGMYLAGTDLGFSVGNAVRATLGVSGNFSTTGSGSIEAYGYNLRSYTSAPPIYGITSPGGTSLAFAANSAYRLTITSAGNVGIGTSAPSYQLQLSTDSAAKPSTNTWTIASDERIKNVTGEYTKGLDAVCSLRPITYEYNGAAGFEADGKENISIIAQEAIQHFPECVGTFNAKLNETDETETELYNWNGHALTFALVNAIKELKAELDTVKSELNALKNA